MRNLLYQSSFVNRTCSGPVLIVFVLSDGDPPLLKAGLSAAAAAVGIKFCCPSDPFSPSPSPSPSSSPSRTTGRRIGCIGCFQRILLLFLFFLVVALVASLSPGRRMGWTPYFRKRESSSTLPPLASLLALSWPCPGPVLALSWPCPGPVLALSWPSPSR